MPHFSARTVPVFLLRLIVISSVGLSSALAAEAAPGDFVISGNSHLGREAVIDEIGKVSCPRLDSLCVASICSAVAEAYWAQGYLAAEVRCERVGESDTVRIDISEGPASLLGSVRIEGAYRDDKAEIEAIFADKMGLPFSQYGLEQGIDEALGFYDVRGYPLAKIEPEIETYDGDRIGVVLRIRQGPRARLGSIRLNGLKKTKEAVVLREMGLSAGGPYDGDAVDNAQAKLMRLGIFEDVSEPVLGFDSQDTTVSVTFDLGEARTNLFEGLLAYSPSAKGTRLVGSFDLETLNFGGSLRRARILWMKKGDDRLNWSLYYREPRIAGKPFALETSLASDVVDTSYSRRKFWIGVTFHGEMSLEIGTGGFIGATMDRTREAGEGNFKEKGLSFYLRHEGRARPLNPRSGEFFEVSHEVESLDYTEGNSPDRTLSSLKVVAEYIAGLGASTNLALGSRFQGVFSSAGAVPASHVIRVGGMASLRGYGEEWFSVEKALTVSLEARRLLGPYSRVYVFFDAATIENQNYTFGGTRNLPFGYGFGLMGGTTGGVLRLEVAMGRDDAWSEAKLHLGLVQRF